jgi:hypothetical protein
MKFIKRNRIKLLVVSIILLIGGAVLAQGLIKGFDRVNRQTVAVNVDALGNLLLGAASATVDDDCTTCCQAIAGVSTNYALPAAGTYKISVNGNTASVLCGAAPVATTAVNGHFVQISSGSKFEGRLTGPICAHIAAGAGGQICFVRLQ